MVHPGLVPLTILIFGDVGLIVWITSAACRRVHWFSVAIPVPISYGRSEGESGTIGERPWWGWGTRSISST